MIDSIPHGPLFRMRDGLNSLPPIKDVCLKPIELGDWCLAAPLWGNPLFPEEFLSPGYAIARGNRLLGNVFGLVCRLFFHLYVGTQTVLDIWGYAALELKFVQMLWFRLPDG